MSPFSRRSPGPLYVTGQFALLVSIGALQLATIVGLSAHTLPDAVVAHTKLSEFINALFMGRLHGPAGAAQHLKLQCPDWTAHAPDGRMSV